MTEDASPTPARGEADTPATPPTSETATTATRRLAAGATFGGALILGVAASRLRRASSLLVLGGLAVAAYVAPLVRAGRRPPLAPLPPDRLPTPEALPTVSFVVAGRDEAAVLPALVRDVAAQDHRTADGTPRFELIVVDDRSLDGTAVAVTAAAEEADLAAVTRVIRRGPPEAAGAAAIAAARLPDGKGAALTSAQPEICRGDIVAVLDADARIAPDYARRVASYVARGAGAVTARRRMVRNGEEHGPTAWLVEAQDDEQTADGEIQRGRWALGGLSEFRGNGISVRRDLLAEVGGWRAVALTEDLDLSSRLAALRGITVAWAIDAVVWEEPVIALGPLWRQRRRWAEGIVRRQLELTPSVLASPALSAYSKADYLAYSAQTVLPIALAGAAGGAVVGGRWRPSLILAGWYLLAGSLLAFDSLRWTKGPGGEALGDRERVARAVAVTVFSAHWLAALPVGWLRVALGGGPLRYAKMAHLGAPAGWRPDDGTPRSDAG